jgi:hypothetical protein
MDWIDFDTTVAVAVAIPGNDQLALEAYSIGWFQGTLAPLD